MQIVAGLNLKGIKPRVWNPESEYYLPELKAVMISYADFHGSPLRRQQAMEKGLHEYLGVPKELKIYLDNGAFYFLSRGGETSTEEYEEFVEKANPDWYPIPQDFIPTPKMTPDEQKRCFKRTMQMNLAYQKGLYIPVIHISDFLRKYVIQLKKNPILLAKPCIALGGIVPNLLRASKAMPPKKVLENLQHFRQEFKDKKIHVFGIGGTATLHLAALLGINSVDSCGWRNRAARGMIQLPGTGERIVANLGNWRGRKVSQEEEKRLRECPCPACKKYGLYGLKASGIEGFSNRATHNLWILLEETRLIEENLISLGTYKDWYKGHLDNSTYRPLIDQLVEMSLLED
jgi:queuine/archaeosine tRNA-ribosyltransferase